MEDESGVSTRLYAYIISNQTKVWHDMENIFQQMTAQIKTTNDHNTAICSGFFTNESGYNPSHRAICRQIVNIYMFMSGFQQVGRKWVKRQTQGNTAEFEKWVRCIMGNVALVEMFGQNCAHVEIAQTVSAYMKMEWNQFEFEHNSEICQELNYDKLIIGTKYVGLTMADWIRSWRKINRKGQVGNNREMKECQKNDSKREQGAEKDITNRGPIVRMFQEGEVHRIHKVVEYGQNLADDKRRGLIEKMKEGGNPDIKGIIEEIYQQLHVAGTPEAATPAAVHPPATTAPGESTAGTDKNKKKEDSSNGQVVTTTPEVPPTKVPEVPKAVVPEKNTPQAGSGPDSKGRNDEGLPDALPQPPSATGGTGGEGQGPGQGPAGPVPQPPPAAPPKATGAEDTGTKSPPPPEPARPAAGEGEPSQDSKETGKCSKGIQTYTVKNAGDGIHGATSSTAVSFASGAGTDDDCDQKSKDTEAGAAHADSKSKKDTQAPDAGVATNPDGQAHNTSSCTSSEFSCTSGALESVLHTLNDTVTSGGTQSASGGHNAGNAHAGNVDCTANPLHDSCDLRLEVPFVPSVKLSDGHFGPGATPAIRDLNHDGVGKEDVPIDIPDLTDTVLTATTPVLFFLASVTVAILGYSLWK
ncbi:hypothetical protein AK88_05650, partial [Plasmodium fragile]